ncbi:MAG TPA: hypothetical protein DCY79_06750 [Planctomycetaceae bacterium]|nr:hypothetical protein [Blastopirellula sp.]HAY79487.1 hypothetical protein [Planctomycetaceae bacterium]
MAGPHLNTSGVECGQVTLSLTAKIVNRTTRLHNGVCCGWVGRPVDLADHVADFAGFRQLIGRV